METIWLHGPGDLVCLKDSFTFVVKAISMKMMMKQYYFILLVLINVHHMSHLIPIKIWNTWNLRFQALTTQNHDILETEKANLPSVQQFFVKLPGQNIAEASVWYSHGWRTYYFTMLIVSLQYCCLKQSTSYVCKFILSVGPIPLGHHRIHCYFHSYIFKCQKTARLVPPIIS